MYKPRPGFLAKRSLRTPIWRYMKFTKFMSLLSRRALFFSTVDQLRKTDRFEGLWPHGNMSPEFKEARYKYFYDFFGQESGESQVWLRQQLDTESANYLSAYIVVNCWHINTAESALMWRSYLEGSNEGVAIKTTYKNLKKSFVLTDETPTFSDGKDIPIYIGDVQYINYLDGSFSDDRYLNLFMHKHISYECEQELRALSIVNPELFGAKVESFEPSEKTPDLFSHLYQNKGLYFPVDLEVLIQEILIAPDAPRWFAELVESQVKSLQLDIPVNLSSLSHI